ncbi:hypothetical protein [Pseudomonas sp. MAG733B]|uniref:hypothetical protein n=1 Tax=Pseudomonas sp. MAG733B TaxID=3122079 RepID=UPI0030D247C8
MRPHQDFYRTQKLFPANAQPIKNKATTTNLTDSQRGITMTKNSTSVYLKGHNRLGDVIAAIQVMGKYGYYKLDFETWATRISGDKTKSDHWKTIFSEHPEFFRFDTEGKKASLVWRRSYRRRYAVDEQRELTFSEYNNLSELEKSPISRAPLTSEEISVLISTAISLHERAIQQNQETRWLSSPLFNLFGVAFGALLGWLIK